MSRIDDGVPAFPEHHYFDPNRGMYGAHMTASEVGCGGMTLRDWFAGMALQQFVDQRDHQIWAHENTVAARKELAKAAYNIADEMIATRKGGSQQ